MQKEELVHQEPLVLQKKGFASIERKQTELNRNQERLYEDQLSPDLVTAGVTGYCLYEMSNCLPVDNESYIRIFGRESNYRKNWENESFCRNPEFTY